MCGIHATIAFTASTGSGLSSELRQSLINRGPDHFGQAQRELPRSLGSDQKLQNIRLYFISTVLALRGDHVVRQPLEEQVDVGSVLCWNGEAWRIGGCPVSGNDGEAIRYEMPGQCVADTTLSAIGCR